MGNNATVDILAAAENGQYLSTENLFPGTSTDLSVDKKLLNAEPIRQGQQITFELEFQNLGSNTATHILLVDGYHPSLQLVTDNCGMTEFNVYVGWRYRDIILPSMDAGAVITCTMVFNVVGAVGEEIYNFASIDGVEDNNYRNNRSNVRGLFVQSP